MTKRYEVEVVDSNGTTRYGMDTREDALMLGHFAACASDGSVQVHDLQEGTSEPASTDAPAGVVHYETARVAQG